MGALEESVDVLKNAHEAKEPAIGDRHGLSRPIEAVIVKRVVEDGYRVGTRQGHEMEWGIIVGTHFIWEVDLVRLKHGPAKNVSPDCLNRKQETAGFVK